MHVSIAVSSTVVQEEESIGLHQIPEQSISTQTCTAAVDAEPEFCSSTQFLVRKSEKPSRRDLLSKKDCCFLLEKTL